MGFMCQDDRKSKTKHIFLNLRWRKRVDFRVRVYEKLFSPGVRKQDLFVNVAVKLLPSNEERTEHFHFYPEDNIIVLTLNKKDIAEMLQSTTYIVRAETKILTDEAYAKFPLDGLAEALTVFDGVCEYR